LVGIKETLGAVLGEVEGDNEGFVLDVGLFVGFLEGL
jgi:hypothetical protein